ncbi:MAG: 1-acyl-sn-glycerol-3-phosphate acyltransferase [Hyphomicrobiales bacterium]|nr:1-acyl-sn-glycerol-3-phosphate acyltransferase [Hyphomicrobiales bacterium]
MVMGRIAVLDLARLWARISIWLLRVVCKMNVEFRGLENLPEGGYILAPKHQSVLETFAITLLARDFSYILKHELMWIPFFGWYLKAADQIGINRSSGSSALKQITEKTGAAMKEGRVIFIFPEGTRRPVFGAPKYKYGVAHLYSELDATVVPVALDTGLFWPRRTFLRRPGTAVIEVLPAMPRGLEKEAFLSALQERLETKTNALIAEAVAADPSIAPRSAAAPADAANRS